jgi:uncharacterized protein (DUF983 family)
VSTGVNPYLAALAGRCPHCGEGYLFDGFTKVAARCEACGVDLSAMDAGEGPAVFIILIVGAVVGFAALYVEIVFAPPVWLHLILWLPLTLILCIAMMRPLKGLMIGSKYANRASEAGRHDI